MQRPPTLEELDDENHIGALCVYLRAFPDESPVVVLASIINIQRDDGKLYYATDDFDCTQDQTHVSTIRHGRWSAREIRMAGAAPNWLDVQFNLVVCILPRGSSSLILTSGVFLSGTSRLMLSILAASTHAHAVSFMQSGNRERHTIRYSDSRVKPLPPMGKHPCRFMCPGEIPCAFRHFRFATGSNQHMQINHGLWPDDDRLYLAGLFRYYPCRFRISGEDPCEFRSFKFVVNANAHMQQSHGLLHDDDRLYLQVPKVPKKCMECVQASQRDDAQAEAPVAAEWTQIPWNHGNSVWNHGNNVGKSVVKTAKKARPRHRKGGNLVASSPSGREALSSLVVGERKLQRLKRRLCKKKRALHLLAIVLQKDERVLQMLVALNNPLGPIQKSFSPRHQQPDNESGPAESALIQNTFSPRPQQPDGEAVKSTDEDAEFANMFPGGFASPPGTPPYA
jgi:hypothetical protein